MCNITSRIEDSPEITGYKIAVKIDGKYYSPSTGIKYKVGKVPEALITNYEIIKRNKSDWFANPLIYRLLFDKRHTGHTQLFKKLEDAKDIEKYINERNLIIIILKMKGIASIMGSLECCPKIMQQY